MSPTDPKNSLAQLDDIGFDGPTEDSYKSSLVERCEALYTKPLGEFTPGDLRVMIGQEIALQYLVPLALDILTADPLVEGDYHPGDLLAAVLGCGKSPPYERFWVDNPALMARLETIVRNLRSMPREVEGSVQRFRAASAASAAPDGTARRSGA
jgi:hypothetical protein